MRKNICIGAVVTALLLLAVFGDGIVLKNANSEPLEESKSPVEESASGEKPVPGILIFAAVMIVSVYMIYSAVTCKGRPLQIDDPVFRLECDDDGIQVGDRFTVRASVTGYAGKDSHSSKVEIWARAGRGDGDWDWEEYKVIKWEGGGNFQDSTVFKGSDDERFQHKDMEDLVVQVKAKVSGHRGRWWCWPFSDKKDEAESDWIENTWPVGKPFGWSVVGPDPNEVNHPGHPSGDDTSTLVASLTSTTQAKLKGFLNIDDRQSRFSLDKGFSAELEVEKGHESEPPHPQDEYFFFRDIKTKVTIELDDGTIWEYEEQEDDRGVKCYLTESPPPGDYITWGDIYISPDTAGYEGVPVDFGFEVTGTEPPEVLYIWDFGDGSPADTGTLVTHTYGEDGLDTVSLTAEWSGPTYAETTYVTIHNLDPTIETMIVLDSAAVEDMIEFTATASDSGADDELTFTWSFGDSATATGSFVNHSYSDSGYGTYLYILTVRDDDNGSDVSSGIVWITGETPVADAGGSYAGNEGSPIEFDGSESTDPDGNAVTGWIWDFGDGTVGYGRRRTHTYVEDGTYYATLTVIDDNALQSAPDTVEVTVNDVHAQFRRVAFDYETQDSVRFSAVYNTPNPFIDSLIYIWAFGDGDSDTGEVVYQKYDPGNYDITLRVEDEDSYVETTWAISIPVHEDSVSDFTLDVNPSYQSVWPGDSTTYLCSLTSINNFSSPCTMSVEGLPFGADSAFTGLHSEHPFAWITLEITTDLYTTYGIYELTVRGKGGGKEATAICTLEVGGACDTTLEVLPGGLFPYYFWKQPPGQFLNMQFEMPLDLGGRLQSFNITFWGDGSTGTPDPDFYVWPSDGMFPQDENPPSEAVGDYHLSYDDITWFPDYTTVQAYFHDLVFDPGEVFHIGFSHAHEPGDTLAIMSDDGGMGTERSSGWDGFGWTTYSPYEFLINAVICPIAPTFTMDASPPLAIIAPGDQWVDLYQIEIGSVVGYAHNVTLSLLTVTPPENISASFTPNGVPTPYFSDVAISVDAAVPEGDYILTFQGFGDDAQTRTCDVTLRVQWPLICGDCVRDGTVDLGDAVHLLNYLFKGGAPPDPVCLGDVNCDAVADIADVIYVINYLFKGDDPPCQECCSLKAATEKSPIQTTERDSQPIRRIPEKIPQAPGDLKRIN